MSGVYYNEIEPYCVEWLKNLVRAGLIPDGDVDSRSIVDVQPEDLHGYDQWHFFCGIGGWPLALRLAGWADDREIVTGSCPCQPFSVAGKQAGTDDARHLWPHYFRLVNAIRPNVAVGEQVAAAIGKGWLDGVFDDLEGAGYACEAFVLPACAVNAPHRRDRIWFAAARGTLGDCLRPGLEGHAGNVDGWPGWASENRPVAQAGGGGVVADGPCELLDRSGDAGTGRWNEFADGRGASRNVADANVAGPGEERQQRSGQFGWAGGDTQARDGGNVADDPGNGWQQGQPAAEAARHGSVAAAACGTNPWAAHDWIIGHDGKARRIPAGAVPVLRSVADGVPAELAGLRASNDAEEVESKVITLLASGVLARTGKLKGLGNAIVPELAAEFICALMECMS